MPDSETIIRLTFAEAAVLDEILRRFSLTGLLTAADDAERQALYNLECLFERDGDRPLWPSLADAKKELYSP